MGVVRLEIQVKDRGPTITVRNSQASGPNIGDGHLNLTDPSPANANSASACQTLRFDV